MRGTLLATLVAVTAALSFGCAGDDDDKEATPPTQPASATMPAVTAASQPPSATATRTQPPATPRPAATRTPIPGYDLNPKATPKDQPGGTKSILVAVRTASRVEDGGTDRIVFEFSGGRPEASAEYRPAISRCGPGDTLDLAGFRPMLVTFFNTDAHNEQGQVTVTTALGATVVLKLVKQSCDFEALVQYGLGVDAMRPFKMFTLDSPPRVVIDILNK